MEHKPLTVLAILAMAIFVFWSVLDMLPKREGFKNEDVRRKAEDIYDGFYSKQYEKLFHARDRIQFEQETLRASVLSEFPKAETFVLDVGCGLGAHARFILDQGGKYMGLDQSPDMVSKARETTPDAEFTEGDANEAAMFPPRSFSHALCLYFTIYGMKNPKRVLANMYNWLKPSGILVLHLVDPDKFDPLLEDASPFPAFSLQKYSKERLTESEVQFDKFNYKAKFKKAPGQDKAVFTETFEFPDETARTNSHTLHMPPKEDMLDMVRQVGFTIKDTVDMVACHYEYQYLVILQK